MSYSPFDDRSNARSAEESGGFDGISDELRQSALETIASEVLNRFAAEAERKRDAADVQARPDELETLSTLLIGSDEDAGHAFINNVREKGIPIESIYLSYLAGAVRLLGVWWEEDKVTFWDVTLGSVRIYSIMCALSRSFTNEWPIRSRSAVFATVPGETHTLGISTAADLLTKKGWSISVITGRSLDDIVEDIAAGDWRIVGLSAAGSHATDALAKLIVALRIRVPESKIVVGGQILAEGREAVMAMKPDATASNMPETYAALERILRSNRQAI